MPSLALLLAGAAAAQSGPWLDVPFVRQREEGCGAAAIAMVMRYWGREADDAAILRALHDRQLRGIRASELARYFREHGFRAFEFRADWDDLVAHIAKGRPLVIALREGAGALHYVVVAGVDTAGGVVLVNDPARRKLAKLDRSDLERRWNGRWALLALPAP